MKKWIPILCAALLSSLPSAAQLVSHADSVAQRLAAAGFANVRAVETPEFTVYTVENDYLPAPSRSSRAPAWTGPGRSS